MRRSIPILLTLGLFAAAAAAPPPPDPATVEFEQHVRPILREFCFRCHGVTNPAAGLDLIATADVQGLRAHPDIWRKALGRVTERTMPPASTNQPTAEQRKTLAAWIGRTLAGSAPVAPNPGRTLLHRLSRVEYNNSVRDLFGVDTKPADKFPADGGGGAGFDNNADTLYVPPILMERFLQAAGEIVDRADPMRLFFVHPGPKLPPREAARRIVTHFATLAYRRPAQPAEVDRLLALYDRFSEHGKDHHKGVRVALEAVLVSPNFLFRPELDLGNGRPRELNDYELASRLSYFLWSSTPDAELLRVAGAGKLRIPSVLNAQVTRMLADPKSRALAENFATQWLHVRDLYTVSIPDGGKFPNYTPALRDAMYQETIDDFDAIVRENRSLLQLIDCSFTFVNQDLAVHYGIPNVQGTEMRRVALDDRRRGGILTMASMLTVTSYPQRTSPVLRGKWVLAEVLGTPPPPPPPVVPGLSTDDATENGLTFRQRLEQHRKKEPCASCHSRMDPIGFGLENFDATGKWREKIGGTPVDASGVLATGEKFTGPIELKQLILARKDLFIHNIAEKMLAYALGRGVEPYDAPAVDKIVAAVGRSDFDSQELVRGIVSSYPFRYRESSAAPMPPPSKQASRSARSNAR